VIPDVVVVGAGPAGAVAALVLARAGARVRLLDRSDFPRDKLCGDTLNPGTMAVLRSLGVAEAIERKGIPVDGMLVTGERGTAIEGRYPAGLRGVSVLRRELDAILVEAAIRAGVTFEPGSRVERPLVAGGAVAGVAVGTNGCARALHAPVTIAADGRRSAVAFALGVARHPRRPRRWAIGAYFDGVAGTGRVGEMHVRARRYIGVAPVPGGLVNACLVTEVAQAGGLKDPAAVLRRAIAEDELLRDRFAGARMATAATVLGPLAIDVDDRAGALPPGVLLAGDASGFIDPITGDGLRFAVRGGELVAAAALQALERGWHGVPDGYAAARQREFAAKWRFNRLLRAIVASRGAVAAAGLGARIAPAAVRAIIARAGDCDAARRA
jgi:flavin-dependent dehydrogenase